MSLSLSVRGQNASWSPHSGEQLDLYGEGQVGPPVLCSMEHTFLSNFGTASCGFRGLFQCVDRGFLDPRLRIMGSGSAATIFAPSVKVLPST